MRSFWLWLWLGLLWASAQAAPAFWFKTLDGDKCPLNELISHSPTGLVVCVVWCDHCASCRFVEDELEKLHQDLAGRATVVAIDASVDDRADSVRSYLNSHKRHFPVLLDPPGGIADSLHIDLTTTTLVFDGKGELRYFGQLGSRQAPLARLAIEELLKGQSISRPTMPLKGCHLRRAGSL